MLNQHTFIRAVAHPDFCRVCQYHRDDSVHLKAERSGFWGALAFFVLTFAAASVTMYDIWASRWDRATYFLVVLLELLRLWGRYESRCK